MFTISFYIFSLFLSYCDYKTFRIPNVIIITMTIFLLIFGTFEEEISKSSLIMPIIVLLFFVAVMLFNRQMILGGGDIKYYMVIALYLDILYFPIFLIITGVLQTLALLFRQNIQHRKVVAMGPVIFLSVIVTDIIQSTGVFAYAPHIGG